MMDDGQVLEIILDDGEPMRNVPRSIKEEGHKVVAVEKIDDGYKIFVKKS
jgi:tRNA 2-thiouridine synthesizing protein A